MKYNMIDKVYLYCGMFKNYNFYRGNLLGLIVTPFSGIKNLLTAISNIVNVQSQQNNEIRKQ